MNDALNVVIAWAAIVAQGTLVTVLLFRRYLVSRRRAYLQQHAQRLSIGFFHPYCAAGGGGERVLWCAIQAVFENYPEARVVIFTGDTNVSPAQIVEQARGRFGVEVPEQQIEFIVLTRRRLVEASTWPRCTLIGQSVGSMLLAFEAVTRSPDVILDTMGYAFTYPIFSIFGACTVGSYTHYPTISTDMLARVRSRDTGVCNNEAVARSSLRSTLKLIYYKIFAALYSMMGRFADVVLVNSSWTLGHIKDLWKIPDRTWLVYPPCDTLALSRLELQRGVLKAGGKLVVSLAQFRPEKDHRMQLEAFAGFLKQYDPSSEKAPVDRVRLVVAGGCRDDGDWGRLRDLQALAKELGLRERPEGSFTSPDKDSGDWQVAFRPNASLEEVHLLLGSATVGLHTMRDEHFGISVVEFMAAGAIPLAHKSAGPWKDIVTDYEGEKTGFLAVDKETYIHALVEIFSLNCESQQKIAESARTSVRERFSQEEFKRKFYEHMLARLISERPPSSGDHRD
mmetsp:Transcript_66659/g.124448  ORF Transcript_66659/g.124448 Transcript_66659/m.124448 type:complete len:509 (-) Transcript_66659:64-1590(-)